MEKTSIELEALEVILIRNLVFEEANKALDKAIEYHKNGDPDRAAMFRRIYENHLQTYNKFKN